MQRTIGTVSRGVRAPIIRQGDDIAQIVIDSVLDAVKAENITLHDRDVIAVTEAVVARAQGNYASIDDIAADVHQKYGSNTIGLPHPEPEPVQCLPERYCQGRCSGRQQDCADVQLSLR